MMTQAYTPTVKGGSRLVTSGEQDEREVRTSTDDQLVEGLAHQAPTVVVTKDNAPTIKGELRLVTTGGEDEVTRRDSIEEGWEGRSSDEEDFITLTDGYMAGGLMDQEAAIGRKTIQRMEDDQIQKEDDLKSSPSSNDGQQSMVTLQGLLESHKEENSHQPPTGTSLTPTEGYHQAGDTHTHSPWGGGADFVLWIDYLIHI